MADRKRNKKYSMLKKLIILFFVLVFLTSAAFAFFPERFIERSPVASTVDRIDYLEGETLNIALLGFDRSAARDSQYSLFRPDTIMIAALNLNTGKVALVSIPRDSYVQINGTNIYDKINHSYMYGYYRTAEDANPHLGGIETVIRTIEDFLGGIAIHDYVIVDMDGAKDIIDSIGGVEIDVEKEVRSNYGRGDILVAAGKQRLDGATFMQYVRSRADNLGGERGRTQRQQKALIAMFRQLLSPGGLVTLPPFYRAVNENIDTTLTPLQMLTLVFFGLRLDYDQIEGYVFAGEGKLSNRDGQNIYYLVIDGDYRVEIIENVFGLTVGRLEEPYLPGPVTAEPHPEDDLEIEPEPLPEEVPEPEPVDEAEEEPEDEPEPAPEPEPSPDPDVEESPDPEESPDEDL